MTRTGRILVLAAATLAAVPARAQIVELGQGNRAISRLSFNAGLTVAQPVGAFGQHVDAGVGLGAGVQYAVDPQRIFSIRGDIGFVVYGNETQHVPIPGIPRIRVDVNTTNNIFVYTLGPQLAVPTGPVRPYVHGFIGGSYFSTSSSLNGSSDYDAGNYFSTEQLGDGVFSVGGEGGILFPLNVRSTPVSIDVGARYVSNGVTRYLTKGDIIDNPDGTLSLLTRETETKFWMYRVGVKVGVR